MNIMQPRASIWLDTFEPLAKFNLAETYVKPLTLQELLALTGEGDEGLRVLLETPLDYRFPEGSPDFRSAVANLYQNKSMENILVTSGAVNANLIVLLSLLQPGDRVVCAHPNYQQLYAVPAALGAEVVRLELRPENDYLPDLDELQQLAGDHCKMLIFTNPNNPTGATMDRALLDQVVRIAQRSGAYLLADETYKDLAHGGADLPNVADLYEKGISTSGLSKVYALSGLRMGWVAADAKIITGLTAYRNYSIICSGVLDELAATMAFRHYDRLMARNQAIVEENLCCLREWLKTQPEIECQLPKAGTFTLLKYNKNVSSFDFCQGLFDFSGTFLMPGGCFDMEGYVRLGFGICPTVFRNGLQTLSDYLARLS